jgi:hypothetical protein
MAEQLQDRRAGHRRQRPQPEAFDEFIGRFTALAQQPVVMH